MKNKMLEFIVQYSKDIDDLYFSFDEGRCTNREFIKSLESLLDFAKNELSSFKENK
jgi:hypothetical protein